MKNSLLGDKVDRYIRGEGNMHKNIKLKKWILGICTILFLLGFVGCQTTKIAAPAATNQIQKDQPTNKTDTIEVQVKKEKSYSTKDEVAAYIYKFKTLPANYITKIEAQKLGWDNSKGNLWKVTNQKSIGGDRFGNLEGLLPKAKGRQYYECDINYNGGYRGAERIIYSNDGLIFYTNDHYKTFKKLY